MVTLVPMKLYQWHKKSAHILWILHMTVIIIKYQNPYGREHCQNALAPTQLNNKSTVKFERLVLLAHYIC